MKGLNIDTSQLKNSNGPTVNGASLTDFFPSQQEVRKEATKRKSPLSSDKEGQTSSIPSKKKTNQVSVKENVSTKKDTSANLSLKSGEPTVTNKIQELKNEIQEIQELKNEIHEKVVEEQVSQEVMKAFDDQNITLKDKEGQDHHYTTAVKTKKGNDGLEIILKLTEENTRTLYEKREIISFTINKNLIQELAKLVENFSNLGYTLNRSDLVNIAIRNFVNQTITEPIKGILNEMETKNQL